MTRPRRREGKGGQSLAFYLMGGVAVAAALEWLAAQAGALGDPLVAALIPLSVALLLWAVLAGLTPSERPAWSDGEVSQPTPAPSSTVVRLQSDIANAAAGSARANQRVAEMLRAAIGARLVRRHGADPADPLAEAGRHLSPELMRYLLRVEGGEAVSLPAATLDTYLKEIESL